MAVILLLGKINCLTANLLFSQESLFYCEPCYNYLDYQTNWNSFQSTIKKDKNAKSLNKMENNDAVVQEVLEEHVEAAINIQNLCNSYN